MLKYKKVNIAFSNCEAKLIKLMLKTRPRQLLPGKPYRRERLSTVDLLILVQVLLYCNYYLTFFYKKASLMRRSTVLSLPLQLVFPTFTFSPVRYSAPCSHIFLVESKTVGSKNRKLLLP